MTFESVQDAIRTAIGHHQAGRLAEAEAIYRGILAQNPNHPVALHLLGVVASQVGQLQVAHDLIQSSLRIDPANPEAYNNLSNVLKAMGRLEDALRACDQALALNPTLADALSNRGNVLRELGRLDEAVDSCRRAIRYNPSHAAAHNNLAAALRDLGQYAQAIEACRQAIALKGDFAEAHYNLALSLRETVNIDGSIAASLRALELRPNLAEAHNNLGLLLRLQGRLDESAAAFASAIRHKPALAEAHSNLANVYKDQGRIAAALTNFARALHLKPSESQFGSNFVYTCLFDEAYDAQRLLHVATGWARKYARPLATEIRPHPNERSPDRKLRIGYISPDFRDHVVGRNVLPLLQSHDRENFEVFCYANVRRADATTERFRAAADHWRDVLGRPDAEVAETIRADQIDILVDLALHMADNRLLVMARKPAPVQVTFAGYPGGTGIDAIDYRLSDPYLDPPGGQTESDYVEKTLRLPHSFWCYDPAAMDAPADPPNPPPALETGAITFGCVNNFCKVTGPTLDLWARVLCAVQGSRLIVLCPEGSHRSDVLARLQQGGVARDRVELLAPLARADYMAQYCRIDIGLDTLPYNGHTTSLDSLWMGVPVVTLVGKTVVGRAGWSQLNNLNLTELAAQTPEEFVRIATRLAGDLPRLAELRRTLRERMLASPLTDAASFTRGVEAAYRFMWRRWAGNVNL